MTRLRLAAATLAATMLVVPAAVHASTTTKPKARTAASCTDANLQPSSSNLAAIRRATLCLVNVERTQRGRTALRSNGELADAADAYADEMVAEEFFSHVSPTGSTFIARIKQTDYLDRAGGWALGENLAWGQGDRATPTRIVQSWMSSAGHRRNILDSRFTEIGVGVGLGTPVRGADDDGATYVTEFGSRSLIVRARDARR